MRFINVGAIIDSPMRPVMGLSLGNGNTPLPPPRNNPEEGLILSATRAVGEFPTTRLITDANAVFAADFTGLDGSAGGLIAETGAVGRGAYAGFNTDGTFIIRFGNGRSLPRRDAAVATVDPGVIQGDGTLVVEIEVGSPATATVWWNGELLATGTSQVGIPVWTGANTSTYLAEGDLVTAGQASNPVAFTTASELRYYARQRVISR